MSASVQSPLVKLDRDLLGGIVFVECPVDNGTGPLAQFVQQAIGTDFVRQVPVGRVQGCRHWAFRLKDRPPPRGFASDIYGVMGGFLKGSPISRKADGFGATTPVVRRRRWRWFIIPTATMRIDSKTNKAPQRRQTRPGGVAVFLRAPTG
jgi:hypothetical protein